MEQIKVKGIVLKFTDYKDSDKLVTVFSAEMGVINIRVRGVKKSNAKLAFAVQPFAFVEYILSKNGNFYTCINATCIDQFFAITSDFDNYIFMLACMEVCLKTIREGDIEVDMFLMLLNAFKLVCYENFNPMYVFIKFMLSAFDIFGFHFHIKDCVACGSKVMGKNAGFSYEFNGVICEKCSGLIPNLELSMGEYSILKFIDLTEFNELSKLNFKSRDDVISVISLLVKDFRILTDFEIESIKKFL